VKKPAVGRAVLIVVVSFFISAACFAFTGPVGSSGLTTVTQPEIIPDAGSPPEEGRDLLMIPVSMQTPPDTSQAVAYDSVTMALALSNPEGKEDIPLPLPVEVLDSFEAPLGTIYTWWDIDGTEVYKREFVKDISHSGSHSMRVRFRKSDRKYAFSFFALQPTQDGIHNDFSEYDKLIFWLYVPKTYKDRPLELLVKFEDDKKNSWEEKFKLQPKEEWQLIEVDLSQVKGVNLSKINNVLFFADPGIVPSAGEFWMDDICLIKEGYEVPEKAPNIPQIEQVESEFGLIKIRWSDELESGALLYELWMADNQDFNNADKIILNRNQIELAMEQEATYYFKVRALSHYLEFGGKASDFSDVYKFEY